MSDADRPRVADDRRGTDRPAAGTATPDAPPTAPAFSMLADDGAACVDGVCALPDPASR